MSSFLIGGVLVGLVISVPIFVTIMHDARNISLPQERVESQCTSCGRSTMTIVSECLATMFICVVTAMHFDVPPKPANRQSFRKRLCSGQWMIWMWKLCWWIMAFLAIEVVAINAVNDLLQAKLDVIRIRRRGYHRWTLKMSLFAYMGGFDVNGQTVRRGTELMDTFNALKTRANHDAPESVATLDYSALEDDIDDKSKADGVAKFLAVLQISRLLLGTAARLVQSLPISPLEYVTCSYAICAVALYGFWFHKPSGVQSPIRLTLHSTYILANEKFEVRGPRTQFAPAEGGINQCAQATFQLR